MTFAVLFVLFTISMTSGAFAAEQNSTKCIQPVVPVNIHTIPINVKVNETFCVNSFHTDLFYDPNYVKIVKTEKCYEHQGCIAVTNTKYYFKALKPGNTTISYEDLYHFTFYSVTITP